MQFSLRQIQYFLAAAETGQFSAAAAQVHVTQTAITAGIKELESALGIALFHRHHASGVSLTLEGQKFLQHAYNINAAVNSAIQDPGLVLGDVVGKLRIGATHSILGSYLVPALARFMRAYSRVELEVVELKRAPLELALQGGTVDLGVVWLDNVESGGVLATAPLTRSRRQLWLCANHPLLDKRHIGLSDLHSLPYVLYNQDDTPRNTRRFWTRLGLEPNVRFKVTSIEAVRSLVAQGLAVTILADVAYRPFSSEGLRIEARPLFDALPAIEIGLAWHVESELSPQATAFKNFLHLTFGGPGAGVRVA